MNKWFLLILSALLFACSFVFVSECWWFVFFFLSPLFYIVMQKKDTCSFKEGFVWGFIFWTIFFSGFFVFMLEKRALLLGSLSVFLLCIYCSLWSGSWFWLANNTKKFIKNRVYCTAVWIIFGWLYFIAIDRCVFIIFDVLEGNPFSFPLLPLMQHPSLLHGIMYAGKYGYLLLLMMSNVSFIAMISYKKFLHIMIWLFSITPFLLGLYFNNQSSTLPMFLQDIAVVVPSKVKSGYVWDQAFDVFIKIKRAIKKQPGLKGILLPESSFPFVLNNNQKWLSIWFENIPQDYFMLMGSQFKKGDNIYNSFFYLQQCRIIQHYDKKHLVFFTEREPFVFKYLSTLFYLTDNVISFFSYGLDIKKPITIPQIDFSFIPYLCSELFFTHTDTHNVNNIVCLINDTWFSVQYMKKLLYLCAQFKSLCWQKNILYISYNYQVWINRSGQVQLLPCLIEKG